MYRLCTLLFAAFSCVASVMAQTKPVFRTYEFTDKSIIQGMSDNGKWAVSSSNNEGVAATHLINLDTRDTLTLSSEAGTEFGTDVSNDGTVVVGHVAGVPSVWTSSTGAWVSLPIKKPYTQGVVSAVTPDGKTAVGNLYYNDGFNSIPAIWTLNENGGALVQGIYSIGGLPTKDMSHQDQGMMDFRAVSADGNRVLGCMSYSYLPTSEDLGGCFFFVYNRTEKTYQPIGFTETATGRWDARANGLTVVMNATLSNNGRYVTGQGHMTFPIEGSDYAEEYAVPFLYDIDKDEFVAYDETTVHEAYGSAVTNDGVVLMATPVGTPVREWSVRSGKYWFSLTEILRQKYGTTFASETSLDNTGTVNGISDDGCRLSCFPDPYVSYVVDLPEGVQTVASGLKLLRSYSVNPEEGSEVSHLKNVTIAFDRTIAAVGGSNSAEIHDAQGNTVYTSVGFSTEGKQLSIRFRTATLAEGESYTLFIPAGSIALADDATATNGDIEIAYRGRHDQPVALTGVYPEEGTAFSRIEYGQSPVLLYFDTPIAIAENATANLYRNDEAEPYCALNMAYSDNILMLYPSTAQYLFDGSNYRVQVEAGAVTDRGGNNPSAAITVAYKGNYIRQISADDVILFSDDFNSGLGAFMQWCGDQLTPNDEMVGWDFSTGMAWGLVLDDAESSDLRTASHSMYANGGTSDDWLVIPQLYIPDMQCALQFLSQSYKADKQDRLKVVVWESNNVYNTLTDDIIAQMKSEGKVIYDEIQTPGASEDLLAGEWTENRISLSDFAGKNVYIAFVNQNTDQSAIFMDSVQVRHDMDFLVTLDYEQSVVNQSETPISVILLGNSAAKTYTEATITLKDAQGAVVDTQSSTGLQLTKGGSHTMTFARALPLTIGIANNFSVHVALNDEENEVNGTVKNLSFRPAKRIVLEEYTGRACGNCPLGVLGMEKLEERWGNNVFPISIHTYNNDPLGSGLSNYSSLLGLDQLGAPSGIINRIQGCYPAVSAEVGGVSRFFFTNMDSELPEATDKLWMDYAEEAMAEPAECGIEITTLAYDEAGRKLQADCEIRYALNAKNQTVNLFAALVEDNVSQAQSNYMSGVSSPDLGEWGLGGRFGQSVVTDYLHQDVCRNLVGLTINGTGGYIPSTVSASEVYKASVTIPVPSTVQSLTECKAIVMMIDANTGRVINAARLRYTGDTYDSVDEVLVDEETLESNAVYNLMGQRVERQSLRRGIYVRNGKKYLVK